MKTLIFLFGMFMLLIVMLPGGSGKSEPERLVDSAAGQSSRVACRLAIKKNLKWPGTASISVTGQNETTVVGDYQSKNDFGNHVRGRFACHFKDGRLAKLDL